MFPQFRCSLFRSPLYWRSRFAALALGPRPFITHFRSKNSQKKEICKINFQESDYRVDEELNRLVLEESELRDADAAKKHSNEDEKSEDDPG